MKKFISFIRLVRLPNLLIILFSQYMVRYAFLYPIYKAHGVSLQLHEGLFFLFSLAFVLLAAGGYIINDYQDVEIDRINRPEKMVIGNGYTQAEALELYWIISLTGVVIGFWTCYEMGLPALGALFFMYLSGLWYYSTDFKYIFLIGNIIVSLFIALVPFTAGLVEIYADVKNNMWGSFRAIPHYIYYGVIVISLFAFLANLAREIIKDVEDVEGDEKAKCKTAPIVLGIRGTKLFVSFILFIIFCMSGYLAFLNYRRADTWSIAYIIAMINVPVIGHWVDLYKAATPQKFHKISTSLKVLMVSGISYLFVFAYYYLHRTV